MFGCEGTCCEDNRGKFQLAPSQPRPECTNLGTSTKAGDTALQEAMRYHMKIIQRQLITIRTNCPFPFDIDLEVQPCAELHPGPGQGHPQPQSQPRSLGQTPGHCGLQSDNTSDRASQNQSLQTEGQRQSQWDSTQRSQYEAEGTRQRNTNTATSVSGLPNAATAAESFPYLARRQRERQRRGASSSYWEGSFGKFLLFVLILLFLLILVGIHWDSFHFHEGTKSKNGILEGGSIIQEAPCVFPPEHCK